MSENYIFVRLEVAGQGPIYVNPARVSFVQWTGEKTCRVYYDGYMHEYVLSSAADVVFALSLTDGMKEAEALAKYTWGPIEPSGGGKP